MLTDMRIWERIREQRDQVRVDERDKGADGRVTGLRGGDGQVAGVRHECFASRTRRVLTAALIVDSKRTERETTVRQEVEWMQRTDLMSVQLNFTLIGIQ